MARSLMELYGGGMVYPANNYQLGGLIAGARRGREYQGEIRELRNKAEAAARRKKKSGFLGSIGSIVGGTIGFAVAGPAGAAIGAGLGKGAGESSYARESYKGGKYAQETRGDLRNLENDYRKGIGERALVAGLQAAVMPGVYDKLGKVAGQGAGWLKGLGSGSGTVDAMGLESGLGIAGTSNAMGLEGLGGPGAPSGLEYLNRPMGEGVPGAPSGLESLNKFYGNVGAGGTSSGLENVSKLATGVPLGYEDVSQLSTGVGVGAEIGVGTEGLGGTNIGAGGVLSGVENLGGTNIGAGGVESGLGFLTSSGDASAIGAGVGTEGLGRLPEDYFGAGYDSFLDPSYFGGEAASSDWYKRFLDEHKRQESVYGYQSGGLINYMMPRRMQGGGYATATDPLNALEQMGFEGIADDERLQDYLEDLPDWQQGYAQQVGDITTAGQQQMGQIGAQMRQLQASSGFGGSGIGAGAAQQARTGVGQEFQRGRRGIVEGFQGDLLTAVRDIESKGEFEFGAEEQEQTATAPTYEDPFDFTGTQHPEPAGGCPAGSTWNGSQGKCQSDDPFSNDPVMTCTERGMPPPAGGCPPTEYWNSNTCTCEWTP